MNILLLTKVLLRHHLSRWKGGVILGAYFIDSERKFNRLP